MNRPIPRVATGTVVLVDEDVIRAQRILGAMKSDDRFASGRYFDQLNEAFMSIEADPPDLVVVSDRFARCPEFPMFRHLLVMLKSVCFVLPSVHANPAANLRRKDDLSAFVEMLARRIGLQVRNPVLTRDRNKPLRDMTDPQRLILVGSSTGGTEALSVLLSDFAENCPPTLIVQHMRDGFIESLVARLNKVTAAQVEVARHGAIAKSGQILIAGDAARHLTVNARSGQCSLVHEAPMTGHRPSVDRLFKSAVDHAQRTVAVLLTGMGRDGAEGMLALRQGGARTIAQDEESCVVYGMPRAAVELGAVDRQLPLSRIAMVAQQAAYAPVGHPR